MSKNLTKKSKKLEAGIPTSARFFDQAIAKYHALFDSNMIGVASTDFNDTIFHANDAFLSLIGYTKEDVENGTLRWSTISPKEFEDVDNKKMDELFANKTIVPFEKEFIHKKGYTVPVLVGAETIDDTFSIGVCFVLDISQLREFERKKDDFIGMVSHELRTPLTVIKLYADYLKASLGKGDSKRDIDEYLNEIHIQIDKIKLLITDLFNMSRYEAKALNVPITAVNLYSIVREVVTELSLVKQRKIILKRGLAVYSNANKERISQVMVNFINNAIRYSEEDIVVRVYEKPGKACIEVEDFGMGIKKENLAKIFERYYRINHADDYAKEGAGIGLYICNEIIKSHQGEIKVKSKVGHGSTFIIELPLIKRAKRIKK